MFNTIFSGHNRIWGEQKKMGGALRPNAPRGYIRKVYYMNEIYTNLRHNLPSICEVEINS